MQTGTVRILRGCFIVNSPKVQISEKTQLILYCILLLTFALLYAYSAFVVASYCCCIYDVLILASLLACVSQYFAVSTLCMGCWKSSSTRSTCLFALPHLCCCTALSNILSVSLVAVKLNWYVLCFIRPLCVSYCAIGMHSADYAVTRCPLSVSLSVCLSHADIVSKRLNTSSDFFHHPVATPF